MHNRRAARSCICSRYILGQPRSNKHGIDEQCDDVLRNIGLWNFVQERGGLKASMNASTFSAGQRQLMSVGPALLRRRLAASDGGILLLDKVSSSVDRQTERLV